MKTATDTQPNASETYFGLPAEVKFCKRCVISNQRPNSEIEFRHNINTKKRTIHFNDSGICDACLFASEKKQTIDWNAREKELMALCDRFRKDDGSYDCLVPGSGGKDSFYAAHILKYKYGMHPLTVTWAPHQYTEWGWRNLQNWIHAGFDNLLCTPNGRVHRLLTRLATETIFHPFQPFILGQKQLAPRMAILHDIELVFYGEHEAEYGNPIQDTHSSRQDWTYFASAKEDNLFLGGVSVKELKSTYGLNNNDLHAYLPVDPELIKKHKIQVHYLGYYTKWHPQSNYYYAVEHGNFEAASERTSGSYSKYNSVDDKIDDFFYYTAFIKFGLGRATDDAAQEVRSGDITRDEAVALVKRFDGEFPERFSADIFKYLSIPAKEFPKASAAFKRPMMDKASFLELADKFRSPHLWKKNADGWELKHAVWHDAHR